MILSNSQVFHTTHTQRSQYRFSTIASNAIPLPYC